VLPSPVLPLWEGWWAAVCRAASEVGGPRRCSGDARAAAGASQSTVEQLQARRDVLREALGHQTPPGGPVVLPRRAALSPSRAQDFKRCPALFRFRAIDRIPEEPSAAALRGTVVHAALEDLHNLPAHERTPDTARALIGPAWQRAQAERPTGLGLSGEQVDGLLAEAGVMLDRYFRIEDPTRFTAAATEARFEVTLDDGTPLRGIIDRIDVAAGGETRVVDYKTSKSPSEAFESSALFQMKFYALALLRSSGVLPARLRLVYLGDGQVLDFTPERDDIERFGKTLSALWRGIQTAAAAGDFPPNPSRLCRTCAHKVRCPAFAPPQ